MSSWAVTVGRWRGVPIRVHASLPVGLYVFSGFRWDPLWWACTLTLILLHELGHAGVVKAVGGTATEVMLTGFGGHCAWRGEVSALSRAAIACGGVGAQLVLLLAALAAEALGVVPPGEVAGRVYVAATVSNAWMAGFNLLPIAPLDGDTAWGLPLLLGRALRRRLTTGAVEPVEDASTQAQAKALVDDLLARARKDDP